MDKKDLEKLLMRFSHLGVSHSKNATLFNFILFFFLISCSPTSIKLVDDYYIYSPDDYYATHYLKCKLSSDHDPVIDSVRAVYWNDSTIIIRREGRTYNWWVIKSSGEKLKCCNNDSIIGPISEHFVKAYMANTKFNRFVFN